MPQEGGVGHGLGVCSHDIVLFVGEVDITRTEGRENVLDQCNGIRGAAMVDDDLVRR